MEFARIQFTPDLMPSDVTGSSIFDQRTTEFEFRPGPDLHEPAPRRRDQPRPAQDPGCAARGDAGAAGDERGRRHARSTARSSSSRRRTPSSTRGRIRCPRRSSTASCSGSASATRTATRSGRSSSGASSGRPTRSCSARSSTARSCSTLQGALEGSTSPSRSATTSSTSSRRRGPRPRSQVGSSPRGSLAILKLARGRALMDGPRLRDARRREGRRRSGARTPPHAEAGALGAADRRRSRSCATSSSRFRRLPPRTSRRRRRDPDDLAEADDVRGARRLRAPRGRRPRQAGARGARGAVRARSGSGPGACARAVASRLVDDGLGADGRGRHGRPRAGAPSRRPRCRTRASCRAARGRSCSSRGRTRRWCASAQGRPRASSGRSCAGTGARTRSVRLRSGARDALGLLVYEQTSGDRRPLKVYPLGRAAPLRAPPPRDAGVRREPGRARPRRRASSSPTCARSSTATGYGGSTGGRPRGAASSGSTSMHPERNTDVVIFLDTFAEARREDAGTLDLASARPRRSPTRYLARRTASGSSSFGGVLNWLTAGDRDVQLYRIVDALLDAEILLSYAWKDIDVIPRADAAAARARRSPLSPLLDERALAALARPARARLRPRRHRALARPVRAARGGSDPAARIPALAAPP